MQNFSPYHCIPKSVAEVGQLPAVLFTTSTRDDRVHPAHARKMVKRLRDAVSEKASKGVYYYENTEGGHGGAADSKQRAYVSALTYSFLHRTLFEQK